MRTGPGLVLHMVVIASESFVGHVTYVLTGCGILQSIHMKSTQLLVSTPCTLSTLMGDARTTSALVGGARPHVTLFTHPPPSCRRLSCLGMLLFNHARRSTEQASPPRDPLIHATRWRWGGRWDPRSAGVARGAGTRKQRTDARLSQVGRDTDYWINGLQNLLRVDYWIMACP